MKHESIYIEPGLVSDKIGEWFALGIVLEAHPQDACCPHMTWTPEPLSVAPLTTPLRSSAFSGIFFN